MNDSREPTDRTTAEPASQARARRTVPATVVTVVVAAVVAVVASVLGNTVVAQTALAAGASEDFQPLTVGSYSAFTVVGVVAGLVGWLLIRRTRRPTATLRWLVPTVLILSWIPDVLLGLSDRTGVSWGAVVALMVMHVIVTVAAVLTFARLLPLTQHDAHSDAHTDTRRAPCRPDPTGGPT
ncbi:DUF6069 family protein [Nocardioides sp. BYT-33-1]|uniref:DUF6069 family protein n=1 Tax=Nocardioides sp. BYT-33-1 TaxID=3416952 RepID=UPI003F534CB4